MKTIVNTIAHSFAVILLVAISASASATENLEVTTEENSRVIRLKKIAPTLF